MKLLQTLEQDEKCKNLIQEKIELENKLVNMRNSYEAKLIDIERTMQLKDIRLSVITILN